MAGPLGLVGRLGMARVRPAVGCVVMTGIRIPQLELHRETLPNGLRVVLAPDRSAPVVAVSVHFDVGFRSEPEGRTGFAHLFEHLMFQGSESLEKLAHFRYVQSSGGTFNGSTHFDYTNYFEVLPSAALERALFLEADRMRAPRITAENLRNQVDVVKEEIRLQVLNRPYGGFPWITLPPVLYDTFPNAHNGYGDFTELEAATVDDCADFFDAYYAPGNAVLTVAGDFAVESALALVHRHFGDISERPLPLRPSCAEPLPDRERRQCLPDPLAPLPALALGYRLPDPATDLDAYLATELLSAVLCFGNSSRLKQRLMHTDELVTTINASCGLFGVPLDARDPDTFTVTAVHPSSVEVARVLAAINEEITQLASQGPKRDELARITSRWAASLFRKHDRLTSRALALGAFELLHGRAELVAELPAMVAAVEPEHVASAAARLRPDSRALLIVEPGPSLRGTEARSNGFASPRSTGDAMLRRSAEEIGHTEAGPRALPPLGSQRTLGASPAVDTVLDNGLRVIAVQRSAMPMVELRLAIPFGGTQHTHAARAEVLAATLLSGTARRGQFDIDTTLAAAGGDLAAGADPEHLTVLGSGLGTGLDELLDVLADALTSASYADAEVSRERARLLERITMRRSQPHLIARKALQRRRYGDHPITRELPDADDVAAVTPAQLRALHRHSLVPRGAVLVLVGDITPDDAVERVAAALTGWQSEHCATELAPLPQVTGADLQLVHRPGAVQGQLRLSAHAVARTDERHAALELANLIFGGYFSSRWVENIREHKGYTYSASSDLEFASTGATLVAEADTASEVTAAALLETRYELGRIALVPPDEAEADTARQYAIGSLTIAMSSQSGLASQLIALTARGLDLDWLRAYPSRLQAVTTAQIAEAAAEFLAPARFTGVVVGDAERLAGPLAALGGVELP